MLLAIAFSLNLDHSWGEIRESARKKLTCWDAPGWFDY